MLPNLILHPANYYNHIPCSSLECIIQTFELILTLHCILNLGSRSPKRTISYRIVPWVYDFDVRNRILGEIIFGGDFILMAPVQVLETIRILN